MLWCNNSEFIKIIHNHIRKNKKGNYGATAVKPLLVSSGRTRVAPTGGITGGAGGGAGGGGGAVGLTVGGGCGGWAGGPGGGEEPTIPVVAWALCA